MHENIQYDFVYIYIYMYICYVLYGPSKELVLF